MPEARRSVQPRPLPALDPAPAAPPPRVLVVEDDELQGRGLLRLLSSLGAAVHVVTTAGAALRAIASQPPYDLVISDLALPDASGASIAERLRRPLLVCYTGYAATPPAFDVVLQKPALPDLLHLLRAPRLRALLVELGAGQWQGRLPEEGLCCHGRSPAHVLGMLARAIDDDDEPRGTA